MNPNQCVFRGECEFTTCCETYARAFRSVREVQLPREFRLHESSERERERDAVGEEFA